MPVKIGFIGTGGIANAHLKALVQIKDAKLAAFCDLDSARVEAAVVTYSGNGYGDYVQMLDAEKLDAVYVCVPPHAHVGQEEELAARGIPFFVEKPVANLLAKAQEIERAVAASGLLTSVGYHWRYMTYTQLAREALAGQNIGMALGYWMGGMPGVYWWRRQEMSGGQMVEQTTHIIDLARHLCGEITEVYGAAAVRTRDDDNPFDVSDVATITVKFASGAVGTISNTSQLQGLGYTIGLHVVTPDVVVEIDHNQFRALRAGKEEIVKGGNNPYLEEDQVFVRAVQTGDPSAVKSSYQDAVKTLAVSLAANESAASGKPVRIG